MIPSIGLDLVLLKGVHVPASSSSTSADPSSRRARRDEAEPLELSHRPRLSNIGASFDLEQASEALAYVAEGRAIGKVVLDVAGG